MSSEYSRPLRAAAALIVDAPAAIEHRFSTCRVLVRLDPSRADCEAMQEAALLAVNEILRFCPNVTLAVPAPCNGLADAARELAHDIHGDDCMLATVLLEDVEPDAFDAALSVGTDVRPHRAWVGIDATGWSARVATSAGAAQLPPALVPPNVLAALAAACLGAGQVFLALVGRALLTEPIELSLFDLEVGPVGTVDVGPSLRAVELEALLVGCGGVANGFAYATARAPITGRLEAVDKQSLREENVGPYVCATRARLGMAKADVIREVLAPEVRVIARKERLLFFRARIGYGQTSLPEIVISALDDERVRHDVQRLWAPTTIDLAAEELTAQVIVKHLDDSGVCLIGAYHVDADAPDELDDLAAALGLPRERVADFESEITEADIATAPADKRDALDEARRSGQRMCGRATDVDLHEEEPGVQFTPAVPFVTAFAGIVGTAQIARQLMGRPERSLHFQFSFLSYRGRKMRLRCSVGCDCQTRRGRAAA